MDFDIREILANQTQSPEQPTREEYAEQKRVEKVICRQMRQLALTHTYSGREPFFHYLDMQARLSNTSAGNTLLILAQNPNAADVRSFADWKEAGRDIKTGETGLLILEANPYEVPDEGANGGKGEGKTVQRTGFNVRRRFDISQTHGLPLTPPQDVPFDPARLIRALAYNPPVRIVESEKPMDIAAFYDSRERVIFVSQGFDAERTFVDLSVSIAEASLRPEARHAGTKLTAFCAGYILCKRAGLENAGGYERFQFDPSYIPEENRMETISDAVSLAAALQARMERNAKLMEYRTGQSERQAQSAGGR